MNVTTYTATYSPDDNKLRLYASQRLDPETYARVKAHGFKWAPAQELFVAPMWTPERAELCEELAGEIGDEDTSLADRAEERAERFEEYSDKRANDAEAARRAVAAIADNIPLGQPILVGHHSEKRARKDAEKIENGMRRAVKMWRTSEYWTDRAAGAIAHAKYKERPDVRARRIAKIESDLRRIEKRHKESSALLAAWQKVLTPGWLTNKATGEQADAMTAAKWLANRDHVSAIFSLAEYPRDPPASQYEGMMSIWSALDGGVCTPEQAQARAVKAHERGIAQCDPWIEHYNFRLSYERAMLAASGGTVSQRIGPEVGGAVRCWASPSGGWSYIRKVNKVSVSIGRKFYDHEESARVFLQTMPLDKLAAVMTRAEVEAARADGRIAEYPGGHAFQLAAPRKPEEPKQDNVCPDGPTCPDAGCITERKAQGLPTFEAMAQQLREGVAVKVVSAPQLFPTPRELADRVTEAAGIEPGASVLEPSAGTGALIEAVQRAQPSARIAAVEIHPELWNALPSRCQGVPVYPGDFLEKTPAELGRYDRIVMNPPFSGAADVRHILHARQFLKPGGRIVAICANGPRQGAALRELAERSGGYFEPLPAGSFLAAGTNVNAALCVIEHEAN